MTPVLFRVFRGTGQVVALFPTLPATIDGYTCTTFAHVGQHGKADPLALIDLTRPATAEEYGPLLEELRGRGYDDLVVRQRATYAMFEQRRQAVERMRQEAQG